MDGEDKIPKAQLSDEDPVAYEAEDYLREAMEVTGRCGVHLSLVPEPTASANGMNSTAMDDAMMMEHKGMPYSTDKQFVGAIGPATATMIPMDVHTDGNSRTESIKEDIAERLRHKMANRDVSKLKEPIEFESQTDRKGHDRSDSGDGKPIKFDKEARVEDPPRAYQSLVSGIRVGVAIPTSATLEVANKEASVPEANHSSEQQNTEDGNSVASVPDLDVVEGFHIFCDEKGIPSIPPIGLGPAAEEDNLPPKPTPSAARKRKHAGGHISPSKAKPGTEPLFGPQVVKSALTALGGRSTAVGIANWIMQHQPEFLSYFGSQRKLRYSVSGILSARTYSSLFQKKLVVHKGIRKADWILNENGELREEDKHISEESLNALLSLSHAQPMEHERDPYEVKNCHICTLGTDDDKLLLCDSCDLGYHIYCLDPPLSEIPSGAWFCENCQQTENEGPEDRIFEQISDDEWEYGTKAQEQEDDIIDQDDEQEEEEGEEEEEEIISPRACEKHRRWKKRCPDNCPMRAKIKPGALQGRRTRRKGQKVWRAKRKSRDGAGSDETSSRVTKQPKVAKDPVSDTSNGSFPTYVEMIAEAIKSLGGSGTTPDITTFMEDTHGSELLATKTKTWRNSVSGCLSTHFVRAGKDKYGRTLWNVPKPGDAVAPEDRVKRAKQNGFKVPPRSSGRVYDPLHLQNLRKANNIPFSMRYGIEWINSSNPLKVLDQKLSHPGHVMGMAWSTSSELLATCSSFGTIRIWDSNWKMLQEIQDGQEGNVEEFNTVLFTDDDKKIITAGRLKDKKSWNSEDEDHEALPSPIKIFELQSGKLVVRLEGHSREILCVKRITFNEKNYLVSAGQDGTVMKWEMDKTFSQLVSKCKFADQAHSTQICIDIDFVPNTGNKFFIVACDGGLKLFDFETEQVVQNFPDLYSSLCDCVKFTECKEIKTGSNEHFLLTKGVELLDENDKIVQPNACHLRRLSIPETGKGKFKLEEVNSYTHKNFDSNIWLLKLATNGRYVLAPTTDGRVFVWNMRSTEIVGILNDHEDREIRDILFHPTKKLLTTCGDDSAVRVYTQPTPDVKTEEKEEDETKDDSTRKDNDDKSDQKDESAKDTELGEGKEPKEEPKQPPSQNQKKSSDSKHQHNTRKRKIEHTEDSPSFPDSEQADVASTPTKRGRGAKKTESEPSSAKKQMEIEKLFKRRGRGLPGACEKHKKSRKKCYVGCPNRKITLEDIQNYRANATPKTQKLNIVQKDEAENQSEEPDELIESQEDPFGFYYY